MAIKFWELSGKETFGAITFPNQLHKEKNCFNTSYNKKDVPRKKSRTKFIKHKK